MNLLTITVWRNFNGSRMQPCTAVFTDWKDFWVYVRDNNIQDKYILIIKPFAWSEGLKQRGAPPASKTMGFWTVDLVWRDNEPVDLASLEDDVDE